MSSRSVRGSRDRGLVVCIRAQCHRGQLLKRNLAWNVTPKLRVGATGKRSLPVGGALRLTRLAAGHWQTSLASATRSGRNKKPPACGSAAWKSCSFDGQVRGYAPGRV
jgi:hypothetical protein